MLLSDYCSLSKDIKTLATRYWLSVILEHLNLQNVNQLSKATQRNAAIKGRAQKCAVLSKFFVQKNERGCD